MQLRDGIILFLSTGGYIGKIPFAPGTFGTLWGIPLCFVLSQIGVAASLAVTVLFTVAAIWFAGEAEKILDAKDARPIVIDEIAGFMVTLWGLPFTSQTAVAGFFIFRFLDILKPFPIRSLERNLPGGAGVVLDDVAAGVYGNLLLRVLLFIEFKRHLII
jgi:phosphatidylglycerophosphatase A